MDVIIKGEFYFKKALIFLKQGRFKKAKRFFMIAQKANFSTEICYLYLGVICLIEMEYSEAFKIFQMVLTDQENSADVYYYMGKLFQAFENHQESLSNYKKAIIYSRNELSRLKAFEIIQDKLSKDEKIYFEKQAKNAYLIREQIPEDEELLRKALLLRLEGAKEQSIELFKEIINLFPDYYQAYLELAQTYIQTKQYHLAYQSLKKVKQHFKKEQLVLKDLAKMSFLLRRFKESAHYTRKLIRINPKNHKLYFNLATSLSLLQKSNQAIKYYQKCIELKKDFFPAFYNIAVIYQKNGFLEESIEYYQQAQLLKPDYPALNYNLALIYFESQDYFEALYYFMKAYELDPNLKEAQENFEVVGTLKTVESNTVSPLELSMTSKVSLAFSVVILVFTFFYLISQVSLP